MLQANVGERTQPAAESSAGGKCTVVHEVILHVIDKMELLACATVDLKDGRWLVVARDLDLVAFVDGEGQLVDFVE